MNNKLNCNVAAGEIEQAAKYFREQATLDPRLRGMLGTVERKVGNARRVAAWNIAREASCWLRQADGVPIAAPSCCKGCFVTNIEQCSPAYAACSREHAEIAEREDFRRLMLGAICCKASTRSAGGEGLELMRLHSSGELYSARHIEDWIHVAAEAYRLLGVRCVAYSRAWTKPELVPALARLAATPGFTLILSTDADTGPVPLDLLPDCAVAVLLGKADEVPHLNGREVIALTRRRSKPLETTWPLVRLHQAGPSAAVVWLALCELAVACGSPVATPTRPQLREMTGAAVKTISTALTVLEKAGWIERVHVPVTVGGKRRATLLRVILRRKTPSTTSVAARQTARRTPTIPDTLIVRPARARRFPANPGLRHWRPALCWSVRARFPAKGSRILARWTPSWLTTRCICGRSARHETHRVPTASFSRLPAPVTGPFRL